MVARNKRNRRTEKVKESPIQLAEGSAKITLNDVYAMFYVLVRQNKHLKKDNVMSFPLAVFKTLPKSPVLTFINENGYLTVDIPDDSDLNESDLYIPNQELIIKKG